MLDFYVVSILVKFGITEDGEDYIGESYYVMAEDKDGNRWNHHHSFPGVKVVDHEDGRWFEDTRIPAEAAALALMNRIKASGITSVDGRPYWSSDRPAYGSKAYQAYGQYNDYIEERMEAEFD